MSERFSIQEIRELVELIANRDIDEFNIERGDEKILIKRSSRGTMVPCNVSGSHSAEGDLGRTAPYISTGSDGGSDRRDVSSSSLKDVTSPMVGTFYRRPSPDAPPYVEVGDIIEKGRVIGIVEAMKVMNEIISDFSGRVVEVCLDDAQMAEYGEVLIRIDPRG